MEVSARKDLTRRGLENVIPFSCWVGVSAGCGLKIIRDVCILLGCHEAKVLYIVQHKGCLLAGYCETLAVDRIGVRIIQ